MSILFKFWRRQNQDYFSGARHDRYCSLSDQFFQLHWSLLSKLVTSLWLSPVPYQAKNSQQFFQLTAFISDYSALLSVGQVGMAVRKHCLRSSLHLFQLSKKVSRAAYSPRILSFKKKNTMQIFLLVELVSDNDKFNFSVEPVFLRIIIIRTVKNFYNSILFPTHDYDRHNFT